MKTKEVKISVTYCKNYKSISYDLTFEVEEGETSKSFNEQINTTTDQLYNKAKSKVHKFLNEEV